MFVGTDAHITTLFTVFVSKEHRQKSMLPDRAGMVELTRQFRVTNMAYMRSDARARQILACAKRVFAARGFNAANISHICEEAGIGRGTLYQYFANKHALLETILRETL